MNGKKRILVILAFLILSFVLIIYGASRNQAKYTVTFIDGYNDKVIDKQIIRPGEDAEVPEAPKHDSFVFEGWYLYGSKDTLVTEFKNIEKDLKVEARYKSDKNKNGIADDADTYYTVRFIDGVTTDVLKTESVLIGMGATAPMANVHENYTFTGWNKEYSNIQGDLDITSVYTRENVVTMYTLNFYDKEGNVFTSQRIARGNTSATVLTPEYGGYTFEGWYLNTNYTERYELGSIVNTNLNIYGKWTINKYNVEFDSNGGTAIGGNGPAETKINVNYGGIIKLPDAERTYIVTYHGNPDESTTVREPHGVNAKFLGWCKGNTITCLPENLIAPYTEVEIKGSAVFVAYWGESESKIVLDNTALRNSTPGLKFTFNGWALANDAEVADYNADQSITLKNDLDLYALWNSTVRKYNVTFNSDGSKIDPLTLDYDAEIDLSEFKTEKTGYTFKGWELVGEGSIPERMPENGFEVIATWEINQYTIKFMDGEDELTDLAITQDYNTDITAPDDLIKEGHTFVGWEPVVPEYMPAEDMSISAVWTVNEYNVSFNHKIILFEWEIGKIKIPYGSVIPTDKIPAVELPVFEGYRVIWRNTDGTEWNLSTDIIKKDLKLYADLKPITYTLEFNFIDGSKTIKTADYNESITAPENTQKTGYTCKWDRENFLVKGNDVITENCTKNTYKVTIKNIYGYTPFIGIEYPTFDIHTLEYEKIKDIPNPTRKGYKFAGWTLAGEGSSMDGTTFTMGHENATLTATWNKK